MRSRNDFSTIVVVLFAFVPLLLFAYLGQFSRLVADDYAYLGKALESGIWESMLFWREQWVGDYSGLLFMGVLAPIGAMVPSFFLLIIIAIGVPSLAWLTNRLLIFLGFMRHRYKVTVALAALTLAAIFNSFYTTQTYLWLIGSVRYTLPAVALILLFAIAVELADRLKSSLSVGISAIAVVTISFINAGFSEMFMVFQLIFWMLLVSYLFVFAVGSRRRSYLVLASAGLLGSLASLPVQLSAPGVIYRSSLPDNFGQLMLPIRDLPLLVSRTLEETFQRVGHQPAFAGFMLVLAAGMLAALTLYKPVPAEAKPVTHSFAEKATALGFIVQLIFIPILWSHSSDNMQVLGRFSLGFAVVIVLNLASVLVFALVLWQRDWVSGVLNRRNGVMLYVSAVFLAIGGLFALSQFRSIHYRAATYLFFSALAWINLLSWQLIAVVGEPRAKTTARLAVLCTSLAALTFAGLIAASLFGQGFLYERVFAPVSFLLMISSLFWGLTLGVLLRRAQLMTKVDGRWTRWHTLLSLLVCIIVGTGIVLGQARRIGGLAESARIWDVNHREIVRLRDAGDPAVYTRQFTGRLSSELDLYPIAYRTRRLHWRQKMYYGLDYEVKPTG